MYERSGAGHEVTERLKYALEAYRDYAQPDRLTTDNVGNSIDAQTAVDDYKAVAAARKSELARTARNEALVNAAVRSLPDPITRAINIDNPNDRALVRQLQANIMFSHYDHNDRYIIGAHQNGRVTNLLFADANEYVHASRVNYVVATVPTRTFKSVQGSAEARLSKPLSAEEIEQLETMAGVFRVSAKVETSMKLVAPLRRRIGGPISVIDKFVTGSSGYWWDEQHKHAGAIPLMGEIDLSRGHENSGYGSRINDCVMEKFRVVEHLAQLAATFGTSDEVLRRISSPPDVTR